MCFENTLNDIFSDASKDHIFRPIPSIFGGFMYLSNISLGFICGHAGIHKEL